MGSIPQEEVPHSERPSAAAKNLDPRWRRGDGDGARGVGRTRGCPRRGPRPYRKGQFPFDTRGAKRPRARARRVFPSRDGLAMEKSMPREHLGLPRHALRSYLILHGDGNNHQNDGAKKHRGVTPRLSLAPSTHAPSPTGVSRHHPIEI